QLRALVKPLIEGVDDSRYRFEFHVVEDASLNAFALPGGHVVLHSGLILKADRPEQMLGVLAHEIAHVTQNHLARGVAEQQRVSLPIMLATLGLVLIAGAAGALDGESAQGLLASGSGLAQQMQINYTRQNEAEADRIGIQLMARAGYDPSGMAQFFETLNRWSRSMGSGPPEYLRTHPLTVSRVAEARDRAEQLRAPARRDDPMFQLVQARLRVLMTNHPSNAISWFEENLERAEDEALGLRYGLALALLRATNLGAAERRIDDLLERDPDQQLFRMLHGELRLAQGRHGEALEIYRNLYRDYGHSGPIVIAYAEALLHEKDSDQASLASSLLREQLRRTPDDIRLTELLARAADRAGDEIRAAEAVATNYYQRGGLPQAIEQLERILQRDDLDYYARARISARLDQMRIEQLRITRESLGGTR
ncbi:MAG: M48 family metalloprotease, partial [Wenzhouxiangellaceae bacterium]